MAVIQCPHCNLEVKLVEGVSGLPDCPHCGKELGEDDDEWFAHWFLLVSFLGVIIFDSLMDPDMFTKDESFWDFLTGFLFIDGSFGKVPQNDEHVDSWSMQNLLATLSVRFAWQHCLWNVDKQNDWTVKLHF